MSKSWAQVRGLNYSTIGRTLRGVMCRPDGSRQTVWYSPTTRWRIEDESGQVLYIENATDKYRRAIDGIMLHSVKSPFTIELVVGSPAVLFEAHQFWPPQLAEGHPPPRLVDASEPRSVEIRGRRGWEVTFRDPYAADRTTYVIDAEIGIASAWRLGDDWMELEDPHLDEQWCSGSKRTCRSRTWISTTSPTTSAATECSEDSRGRSRESVRASEHRRRRVRYSTHRRDVRQRRHIRATSGGTRRCRQLALSK
ncbi:hypothetical protein ABH922_001596 [Rhodococcus sp. 27YEA15]